MWFLSKACAKCANFHALKIMEKFNQIWCTYILIDVENSGQHFGTIYKNVGLTGEEKI